MYRQIMRGIYCVVGSFSYLLYSHKVRRELSELSNTYTTYCRCYVVSRYRSGVVTKANNSNNNNVFLCDGPNNTSEQAKRNQRDAAVAIVVKKDCSSSSSSVSFHAPPGKLSLIIIDQYYPGGLYHTYLSLPLFIHRR